eukprot:TRINITY_DN32100_c0_g1_i1.p1 TRINITY_DN32100_c0_g1~~TRINITY_DN32100_c0_g1_i1.p1  ORF type:complete len:683 (+),score=235.15 TRINITY_DN32100_c0_g1_i1:79-2049(+)
MAEPVDVEGEQWLKANGVPRLMEDSLKALLDERPAHPAFFLCQFFGRAAGIAVPTVGGRVKKRPSIHINVELPTPEKMNDLTLAAILRSERRKSIAVIDVRTEQSLGGKIKGSHVIPCDEIVGDPGSFAARFASYEAIVFVSALSPDLDQTAAVPVMEALKERSLATTVFILVGGLRNWMSGYASEAELVEGYEPKVWGHTEAAAPAPGRKRRGPLCEISVPDPPEQMSASTLAVLLTQRSTGNVVVDVRADVHGGRIPGSIHIPCDQFLRDAGPIADKYGSLDTIVCVSALSPDIDQTAAISLMQSLMERGSKAEVYILIGGMRGWVHDYAGDETLLTDFDHAVWGLQASAAASDGRPKARKKRLAGVSISVPEAPQKIPPHELAALLRGEASSPRRGLDKPLVVVDVREDARGGRIPRSEHIPCEELLRDMAEYADRWAKKEAIVFVSVQSPDLDQTAAQPLLQLFHERGAKAEVFILLDGLRGWFHSYSDDDALVVDYSPSMWASEGHPAPVPARRKKGPAMQITVPDAPGKIGSRELQLLLKLSSCVVVDVRQDQDGGRIPGSQHIPCDDFAREARAFAERWADKETVVFVSVQSPDLDQSAATALLAQLGETGPSVLVLADGLRKWLMTFHANPAFVEGFDGDYWASRPAG